MKYPVYTPDQMYCTFGDKTVYEFVPYNQDTDQNPCYQCALRDPQRPFVQTSECLIVLCDGLQRRDKNDGFWQKSQSVDYQQFKNMRKSGG